MNIVEALNVALPELPPDAGRLTRLPRAEPTIVAREQMEEGRRVVQVLVPRIGRYYTFAPEQWTLLQLFDGERDYEEISRLYQARTGTAYPAEWVQQFAEESQESEFWYRSPQERNRALSDKLKQERLQRSKKKSRWGDLSEVTFSAWDPDKFLTRVHRHMGWVFTPWFLLASLVMFSFTTYVYISHWSVLFADNIELYRFDHKGLAEIVQFWVLMCIIGFIHECCHGLACKHTGGEVHRLGFLLIYLSPAFFCDTTETWVYGGKWQRIVTSAAGLWSSLIICSLASFVWWGTAPGSSAHNFAYLVMLFSGFLPVLINLNPLIKLDGYFIFTEMFELGDLKDNSTAFVSGWVKKHVFGLPVTVPHASFRRRLLYVPYTLFSALYSYTLLYFVVTFSYHVFRAYSPEWAFVPAGLLAWAIFKSRILALVKFMRIVALDKKERVRAWFTPARAAAVAGLALLLLFAPIWRQTVSGRFVLEPWQRAVVRLPVAGEVVEAEVHEGQRIAAGAPLLRLRNLVLEASAAQLQAALQVAGARTVEAQIHYQDYAAAQSNRDRLAAQSRILQTEVSRLRVDSPISGVVLTPRVQDLVGTYLPQGATALEIADVQKLRARVFVSEAFLPRIKAGAPTSLRLDSGVKLPLSSVASLAPATSPLAPALDDKQHYQGLGSPLFYAVEISVPNADGSLRDGMTGTAKILVRRRSLAGLAWEAVEDFAGRKIW